MGGNEMVINQLKNNIDRNLIYQFSINRFSDIFCTRPQTPAGTLPSDVGAGGHYLCPGGGRGEEMQEAFDWVGNYWY